MANYIKPGMFQEFTILMMVNGVVVAVVVAVMVVLVAVLLLVIVVVLAMMMLVVTTMTMMNKQTERNLYLNYKRSFYRVLSKSDFFINASVYYFHLIY